MHKIARVRTTFGSCDVEKWHAAVARSTFASQNAKTLTVPAHFWKFRCRRMARRCRAKHICKSKCQNTDGPRPVLEVQMSKNGTPQWREAHLQVKMHKTPQCRSIFGSWAVENLHAAVARSTFPSQNAKNMACSGHFWTFRSPKMARRCGAKHIYKSKCTKHLRFASLLEVPMSQRCNMD